MTCIHNDNIITFSTTKMRFQSRDFKVESNIRTLALTRFEKEIKCSASLAFDLFTPTSLLNSFKHEHLCNMGVVEGNMYFGLQLFSPLVP